MKKLLHERLRGWAKEYPYSQLTAANDLGCSPYEHIDSVFLAIAAEIEKYYIPRPRFDNGEPVQFGKEFVDCNGHNQTLSSLTYTKGGHGYVSLNGWTKQRIDEPVKRPEPDSLKKAVNDLGELLNFPMCDDIKLDKVEEVYNRLTAIMERDA